MIPPVPWDFALLLVNSFLAFDKFSLVQELVRTSMEPITNSDRSFFMCCKVELIINGSIREILMKGCTKVKAFLKSGQKSLFNL